MIRLHEVSKQYQETWALRDVTLHVRRGQTTVVIGPSGCGKSTLLRLVLGLVRPTRGLVEVDGIRVGPDTVHQLRRRIGYVIQEGGLFPHLTARQNVLLLPRHLGLDRDWTSERLSFLCELARFPESALDRYPAELSGGQRQRVSLMRALVLDPDILLLDEPLGALDPITRRELQDELKRIFGQVHKTVVMVTHDMGEAAYLGDRIVLMDRGRVVQEGPLAELQRAPAEPFVREFLQAQRLPVEL